MQESTVFSVFSLHFSLIAYTIWYSAMNFLETDNPDSRTFWQDDDDALIGALS